jgi:hypothetical protein
MAADATITLLGPCFQCRTAAPPKASSVVMLTQPPSSGVVTVCMLCEHCLANPKAELWQSWMRKGSPPPKPVAGRLLVQTIGVCFNCLATMSTVSDFTGVSGRRMAPTTCSMACEIEARQQLG